MHEELKEAKLIIIIIFRVIFDKYTLWLAPLCLAIGSYHLCFVLLYFD